MELIKKDIIDIDMKANLSSTHAGNAVCCAAGLANLDFLTDGDFQKDFQEMVPKYQNFHQK